MNYPFPSIELEHFKKHLYESKFHNQNVYVINFVAQFLIKGIERFFLIPLAIQSKPTEQYM